MKHKISCIAGDGIGPEITRAMRYVVYSTGVEIEWEDVLAGQSAIDAGMDSALPKETLDSIRKNKVAIKGPTGTPTGEGFKSANVGLRVELGLFSNVRPLKTHPGLVGRYSDLDLDMVIFREANEDTYNGIEETIMDRDNLSVKVTGEISNKGSLKIISNAFCYATANGRKKVTIAHKANILKKYFGDVWLQVGRRIASYHPKIEYEEMIIDNLCGQLVRNPAQFDVIVAPNMFGDIISDIAAEVTGGLGLAPGANIGNRCAVFEAVHGTAPTIAGKGIANPTSLILSAAMMLDYIDESLAAERIRNAVDSVLQEGKCVTADIKTGKDFPSVGTVLMADSIAGKIFSQRGK